MKIKTKIKGIKFSGDNKINLQKQPTLIKSVYKNSRDAELLLDKYKTHIEELQEKFYADGKYALLIILQGMDAAGKDSIIKHIMSGINPQGCDVHSFKKPTNEEYNHDFLWRYNQRLPERGRIGIFNRSYYEDLIVPYVHEEYADSIEKLPENLKKENWFDKRCHQVNDYEKYLTANGVVIMKFFLHISKSEQNKRLLKRINDPNKNWKFTIEDLEERNSWDKYMSTYQECVNNTSTDHVPWYIIPADDKKNARILMSYVLCEMFCDLKVNYPVSNEKQIQMLQEAKKILGKQQNK
jgi:PPK2 family polyphosphate:nucleotide phosphotransferase